jgi:hypothetical protein
MRVLSVLLALLLLVALLAGCARPAKDAGADVGGAADGPGRTGRSGHGGGEDEGQDGNATEDLDPFELLHAPLNIAGQGPVSFDVDVPADVQDVVFTFAGGNFNAADLQVELSGCGSYRSSTFSGSLGSGWSDGLCSPADAGAQSVTVSATFIAFDGQFILTGYVPAANATT